MKTHSSNNHIEIMPAKSIERVDSLSVVVNPTDTTDDCNKNNIINRKDRADKDGGRRRTSPNTCKIEERLNKAVEMVAMPPAAITKNRSPDLIPLTADYVKLKNRLRISIGILNTYQKRTRDLQESRFEVAEQLALLSERTPIYEEIGCELDGEATEKLQQLLQRLPSSPSASSMTSFSPPTLTSTSTPSSSTASFVDSMETSKEVESLPISAAQVAEDYRERSGAYILSLYGLYSFGAAQAVVNDSEYQTHVVDYVTEWDLIVTGHVEVGLKRVRKLASDRLHYERKIETLRNRANDIEIKGRTSPVSSVERLARNEDKLKEAFTTHEKEAGKLCALMEAVT